MAFIIDQKVKCPRCGEKFVVTRVRQDAPIVELCMSCWVKRSAEIYTGKRPKQMEFGFMPEPGSNHIYGGTSGV